MAGIFRQIKDAFQAGQALSDMPQALFMDAFNSYCRTHNVDRVDDPLVFAEWVRDFRYKKFTEYIEEATQQGVSGTVVSELQKQRDQAWTEDSKRLDEEQDRQAKRRASGSVEGDEMESGVQARLDAWELDREVPISSASRVLALLAIERASPGGVLDTLLEGSAAGRGISRDKYEVEKIAFSCQIVLAGFSIFTDMHGTIVSFHARQFITDSIMDSELSFAFSDRSGEYNIAGGISQARPEAEWTVDSLVEAFWENVAPGQDLPADLAASLEAWVWGEFEAAKALYPSLKVVAD